MFVQLFFCSTFEEIKTSNKMKIKNLMVTVFLSSLLHNAIGQNWLWAQSAFGNNYAEGYSVTNDLNGNVFITGVYSGGILYIAKYDSSGNALWAKSVNKCNVGSSVSTDAGGNVYITGRFCDSAFFSPVLLLNGSGTWDVFIVKYDPNGNVL